MPPNPGQITRDDYPENGWSSWWGGFTDIEYPSARPYALYITTVGSTGIFKRLNGGVRYLTSPTSGLTLTPYFSTFKPIGATNVSAAQIYLTGGVWKIDILWYVEIAPPPPFVYQNTWNLDWPNMRKRIIKLKPGPPPFPLISKVGPEVIIRPLNRRGYLKWG